ncbi:NUDIX domain-containing protein [Polynucleobacter kasalickyi]|uniref:GDP-mannose pyrophosphatase n=1 Tax=Polynucleobacter kasalickyi TaxID=1938817 RepID=A0A1W1ZUI8_9BURK|nr:NUDIX hydrolase [Polynucleobacter kasalickyi]SMC52064.1 ADP-ribose pyrophosphatase [Polynucleobacter kasalickyi]
MSAPQKPVKVFSELPENDEHLKEHTLDSNLAYEGLFLKLYRDEVQLPNGKIANREYIKHPGAVAIVPLFNDHSVLLERQFRYPLNRAILEIPAGKLEFGEDPLECAKRELKEETGFEASEWVFLGKIHPVISYSTEFIDIYLAKGLIQGSAKLDEEEFLDTFNATMEEISEWIKVGVITDVKTIISHYWLKDYLSKLSS